MGFDIFNEWLEPQWPMKDVEGCYNFISSGFSISSSGTRESWMMCNHENFLAELIDSLFSMVDAFQIETEFCYSLTGKRGHVARVIFNSKLCYNRHWKFGASITGPICESCCDSIKIALIIAYHQVADQSSDPFTF